MKKTSKKILKTLLSLGTVVGVGGSIATQIVISGETPTTIAAPSIQSVGPTIQSTTPANLNRQSFVGEPSQVLGTIVSFTYDPEGQILATGLTGSEATVEFWFNNGSGTPQRIGAGWLYDPDTGVQWVPPTQGTIVSGFSASVGIALIGPTIFSTSLNSDQSLELLVRVRYDDGIKETNAGVVTRSWPPTFQNATVPSKVVPDLTDTYSNYEVTAQAIPGTWSSISLWGAWVTGPNSYYVEQSKDGEAWEKAVTTADDFPAPGTPIFNGFDSGAVVLYTATVDGSALSPSSNYRFRLAVQYAINTDPNSIGTVFTFSDGTTNPPPSYFTLDTEFATYSDTIGSPATPSVATPDVEAIPSFDTVDATLQTDIGSITNGNPTRFYMEIDFSNIVETFDWTFTATNAITIQKWDAETSTWIRQTVTSFVQPTGTLESYRLNSPYTTFITMTDLVPETTYQFRIVYSLINSEWIPPSTQFIIGNEFAFTPGGTPTQTPGEEFIPPSEVISTTEANIDFDVNAISNSDNWVLNTNDSVSVQYSTSGGAYQTLQLISTGATPPQEGAYGVYDQETDGTVINDMRLQTIQVKGLTLNTDNYQFQIFIDAKNIVDFDTTPGVPATTTFELQTDIVAQSTSGISTGALIGIIVGSVAGVILIGLGVWFYKKQDDPSKKMKDGKMTKSEKPKSTKTDSPKTKTAKVDSKKVDLDSKSKSTSEKPSTPKPDSKTDVKK